MIGKLLPKLQLMLPSPIRLATSADAPAIQAIYAPYVLQTAISFELEPPPVEEIERRIGKTFPAFPWLVWEEDGQISGYAYAGKFAGRAAYQWSVETSVYVQLGQHRQGVGRILYRALLDLLRQQGFISAYAGIALPNAASVGLHESLGFVQVALYPRVGYKLGQWHDVGWWRLELHELPVSPAQPRLVSAILKQEA